MEQIKINNISDIQMSDQPNGTHYLVLKMPNDVHASALRSALNDTATIGYVYSEGNNYFYIHIEMPYIDKYIDETVYINGITSNWMEWLDNETVTELWVCYPDKTGKYVRFGQAVFLS